MVSGQTAPLADEPPWADELTLYDETHFTLYLRLLEAVAASASETDICREILNIDARIEPGRAHQQYEAHLRRARWFATSEGFRHLINRDSYPSESPPL